MSQISNYFIHSELALAAYANLAPGEDPVPALTDNAVGMSLAQAQQFAESLIVVDQYTDSASGLSVTVFAPTNDPNARFLAIRGTEPSASDLTADGLLALGLPAALNPQYIALKAKLDQWLADPSVLQGTSFSVTGHSLGGYLAAALKADTRFSSQITDAYLYNAPGVSGLFGTFANAFQSMFGLAPTAEGVHNIVSSEGGSLVAGLGFEPSPPIVIQTAHQNSVLGQHSISPLTNALMVADTYSQVSTIGLDRFNQILDLFGTPGSNELEDALITLARALGVPLPSGGSSFESLAAGRAAILAVGLGQAPLQELYLAGSDLAALALGTGAEAVAARNALYHLSPVAFVTVQQPDISGFSAEFWQERSNLLVQKLMYNERDVPSVGAYVTEGSYWGGLDPIPQIEHVFNDGITDYDVERGTTYENTRRVLFAGGSAAALYGGGVGDSLFGNVGADQLYGLGGDDKLFGANGDDVLHGGDGDDILSGGSGKDTLVGGNGSDWLGFTVKSLSSRDELERAGGANTYEGGLGSDYIFGSYSADLYVFNVGDGDDTIVVNGGSDILSIRPTPDMALAPTGDSASGVDFMLDGRDLVVWLGEIGAEASDSIRFLNWFDTAVPASRLTTTQYGSLTWSPSQMTSIALQSRGTEDADYLTGITGFSRRFNAKGGDDTIVGVWHPTGQTGATGDTYNGGSGNDSITGSNRGDRYIYARGDGLDTIFETGGGDTLEISGIASSEVTFIRRGKDLTALIGDTEFIKVVDWYHGSNREVESWIFTDTTLTEYNITANRVLLHYGTDGADNIGGRGTVFGGAGDDSLGVTFGGTIYAGDGNDYLNGSKFKDYFYGGAGDDNFGFFAGPGGSEDKGYIQSYRSSKTNVTTYAYHGPAAGQGNYYEGGTGNDTFYGTAAGDTYVYNFGDGRDLIQENRGVERSSFPGVVGIPLEEEDTLIVNGVPEWRARKGGGVNNADMAIEIISDNAVVGSIRMPDWFFSYDRTGIIETFVINGTSYSYSEIEQFAGFWEGNSQNNTYRGIPHVQNQLYGFDGDDELSGGALADQLFGGNGNDKLVGSSGDDLIVGGSGTNQLSGGSGADTFLFYAGESSFDSVDTGDIFGADQLVFIGHSSLTIREEAGGGLHIYGNGTNVKLNGFFTNGSTAAIVHDGGSLSAESIMAMFALLPPEANSRIQILGA